MSLPEVIDRIEALKPRYPKNLALQTFDRAKFDQLSSDLQQRLLACMQSGLENTDSEMGLYAQSHRDYADLRTFFDPAIRMHHGAPKNAKHESNWELSDKLDLSAFNSGPLSCRIRVGRNFADLPMPAAMGKDDFLKLEARMEEAFRALSDDGVISGTYHSLTPGHPNELSPSAYQSLQDRHLMFKDMSKDRFLVAAGISSHWPHGRGCYVSHDENFLVWVGEEDHLRIMIMQTTTRLGELLGHLKQALNHIEQTIGQDFSVSARYGNLTSCPTNLGTAMRASVHLPLPKLLTEHQLMGVGTLAKGLGLALRGVQGEHSEIGDTGMVDVSPSARLWITEAEIVQRLYEGVGHLLSLEQKL